MNKKQKYDPLNDPDISDEDIEKIEEEFSKTKPLTKAEITKLLKKSKKGIIKGKPARTIKKAA